MEVLSYFGGWCGCFFFFTLTENHIFIPDRLNINERQ